MVLISTSVGVGGVGEVGSTGRMLRYGQEYVDKGMELYEEKYKQQQIQLLRKQATKNGFTLAR
jgi:hypothetical protein